METRQERGSRALLTRTNASIALLGVAERLLDLLVPALDPLRSLRRNRLFVGQAHLADLLGAVNDAGSLLRGQLHVAVGGAVVDVVGPGLLLLGLEVEVY